MARPEYSDVTKIDTTNLQNFQTTSVEWAYKVKLFRSDGSTEVHFLNEEDTETIHKKMYLDNQWED